MFLVLVKSIEYFFSVVIVVSPNPCVGSSPRIKIHNLLLSTCTEELLSAPTFITVLPNPPVVKEKIPFLSNLIPYPEELCISVSASLTNFPASNKEFPSLLLSLQFTTVHYCLYSYIVPQIYFINNIYVYCFFMSKCNFVLF